MVLCQNSKCDEIENFKTYMHLNTRSKNLLNSKQQHKLKNIL